MDYTIRSQANQVQKFPFKYKTSFSTGTKDLIEDHETSATTKRPRAQNVRHNFRITRQVRNSKY
jgi:hypothetical protein